jgi:hypothetical protein
MYCIVCLVLLCLLCLLCTTLRHLSFLASSMSMERQARLSELSCLGTNREAEPSPRLAEKQALNPRAETDQRPGNQTRGAASILVMTIRRLAVIISLRHGATSWVMVCMRLKPCRQLLAQKNAKLHP